ncbi:MAG: hypothetical protein ABIK68_01325, partial [bacterium]
MQQNSLILPGFGLTITEDYRAITVYHSLAEVLPPIHPAQVIPSVIQKELQVISLGVFFVNKVVQTIHIITWLALLENIISGQGHRPEMPTFLR